MKITDTIGYVHKREIAELMEEWRDYATQTLKSIKRGDRSGSSHVDITVDIQVAKTYRKLANQLARKLK